MVTVYGFSPLAMFDIIGFVLVSFVIGAMPIVLPDSRGYEPFRSQYVVYALRLVVVCGTVWFAWDRNVSRVLFVVQLLLDVLASVLALLSAGKDATFDVWVKALGATLYMSVWTYLLVTASIKYPDSDEKVDHIGPMQRAWWTDQPIYLNPSTEKVDYIDPLHRAWWTGQLTYVDLSTEKVDYHHPDSQSV